MTLSLFTSDYRNLYFILNAGSYIFIAYKIKCTKGLHFSAFHFVIHVYQGHVHNFCLYGCAQVQASLSLYSVLSAVIYTVK